MLVVIDSSAAMAIRVGKMRFSMNGILYGYMTRRLFSSSLPLGLKSLSIGSSSNHPRIGRSPSHMRFIMSVLLVLGATDSAIAGAMGERTWTYPWFQNCRDGIAIPFCGKLKIDPAVANPAWQLDLDPSRQRQGIPPIKSLEMDEEALPHYQKLSPSEVKRQ